MDIRRIENLSEEMLETLYRWYNDPEIKEYAHPNFDNEDIPYPKETIIQSFSAKSEHFRYSVWDGDVFFGEFSLMNQPFLFDGEKENSLWFSICLGEKDYRSKGFGKKIMIRAEKIAKELGYKRIELGVFSVNERAKRLYESMDYKKIALHKDFTYVKGELVDDIRYEKWLP